MRTFLQSAIDADETKESRYSHDVCDIAQLHVVHYYTYGNTDDTKLGTTEQNVYFLLMIAADLGEL